MNRSSSLLFYKLVSAAIFAGVIASFAGLTQVYRPTGADTHDGTVAVDTNATTQPVAAKAS